MTARAMEGAYLSGSGLLARLPGAGHLDALQTRRVRLQEYVRPGWRAGIRMRRVREPLEEAFGVLGVVRERESDPVGLGLHVPRDDVLQRERERREHHERQQAQRDRLGIPHPAAPLGDPRDQKRARDREERVPGDALEDVLARVVA